MRTLLALTLLVVFGAAVQAKPAPVERQPKVLAPEDSAMVTGPIGAMLESDYFRAPQTPSAATRVFPCRLQLRVFDKTQLARACR
jgi:hypothetical protein